eukprot:EG_transcript_29809
MVDRERARDDRYGGRDWGGRDHGREERPRPGRVMTSTVQVAGRTELPPEMVNKRKQREEKQARAKKQKLQQEEPAVPLDDETAAMMQMMGLRGFTSTKGKPVAGNEKAFGVKTKSRTKFHYMSQKQRVPKPAEQP